jgi:hypothetical protein
MSSLQGLAFNVYVESLSTVQKKAMIDKIQKSVYADYKKWCDAMNAYILQCSTCTTIRLKSRLREYVNFYMRSIIVLCVMQMMCITLPLY